MNIFIEKKTNIGFYNLKDPLGFKLFFNSLNVFSTVFLIFMFKLRIKKYDYDNDSFYL